MSLRVVQSSKTSGMQCHQAEIPAISVLLVDQDRLAEGDPCGEVSNDPQGDQVA
jgi:hypothetical protein